MSASAGATRPACDILDGIGSTEMLHIFLSNRPGDIRYGTTGKPVPGYELRIVDEQGGEVADGEIGELIVRGPTAGEGLLEPARQEPAHLRGRMDLYRRQIFRDADGYFRYCGRTDDMFKVSGMWVSPFEVEAALVSHEAVLEAAVIGKEDADGLIKPKAFIVLRDGYAPTTADRDIAGAREAMRRAVEISALDRYPARPAAHRDRKDSKVQTAGIGNAIDVYESNNRCTSRRAKTPATRRR
jgi:acyl-coenzyme A synthetase/AMP-(fatty) acid ligase